VTSGAPFFAKATSAAADMRRQIIKDNPTTSDFLASAAHRLATVQPSIPEWKPSQALSETIDLREDSAPFDFADQPPDMFQTPVKTPSSTSPWIPESREGKCLKLF
jgi:hypothetical protein